MVDIECQRDGRKDAVQEIQRQPVYLPSVMEPLVLNVTTGDGDASVGYIQINHFQDSTVQDVKEALARLQTDGVQGLILDLRGNPGGTFKAGVQVAELFLDEGVIVYSESPLAEFNRPFKVESRNPVQLPVVVLVDRDTASAAEVVAGALKEHRPGNTLIVGQTTFGKGSIQGVIPLDKPPLDKAPGGIRITIAKLFSPGKHQPYTGPRRDAGRPGRSGRRRRDDGRRSGGGAAAQERRDEQRYDDALGWKVDGGWCTAINHSNHHPPSTNHLFGPLRAAALVPETRRAAARPGAGPRTRLAPRLGLRTRPSSLQPLRRTAGPLADGRRSDRRLLRRRRRQLRGRRSAADRCGCWPRTWRRAGSERCRSAAWPWPWIPFGQYLAAADGRGGLTLYDHNGRLRWHAPNARPLQHLAFIPERPALAAAADFGLVACYRRRRQRPVARRPGGPHRVAGGQRRRDGDRPRLFQRRPELLFVGGSEAARAWSRRGRAGWPRRPTTATPS